MNAPNQYLQRAPTITAVIPTWCAAGLVAQAVARARQVADEVIVADAGSPDDTVALARRAGAKVVRTPSGRAAQLDAGAQAATGDVLLFLHADAALDASARAAVLGALADRAVVAGGFRLRVTPASLRARAVAWVDDARRRLLGVRDAEAGLFVRRDVFESVGGFAPSALFEDDDLLARLAPHGRAVYLRDVALHASAQRVLRAPLLALALRVAFAVARAVASVAQRLGGVPHRGALAAQGRSA